MRKNLIFILVTIFACVSLGQTVPPQVKTDVVNKIKTGLLAPNTFKIHRYEEKVSTPNKSAYIKKMSTKVYGLKYDNELLDSLIAFNETVMQKITDSALSLTKEEKDYLTALDVVKYMNMKMKSASDNDFFELLSKRDKYQDYINMHSCPKCERLWKSVREISGKLNVERALRSVNNEQISTSLSNIASANAYFPIYRVYIVYQALAKGGSSPVSEETYYLNKDLKFYTEQAFWENE